MSTDIPSHVLDALCASSVEEIDIIARRGVVQSAFSLKQLRELSSLPNVKIEISEADFMKSVSSKQSNREMSLDFWTEARGITRRTKFIEKYLVEQYSKPTKDKIIIRFRYLCSPKSVRQRSRLTVEGVEVETTQLEGQAGHQRALATGITGFIPCDLLIYSIGFKTEEIEEIPFDEERKIIPSEHGLVEEGCFVAGWAKTGAKGVLESTLHSTVGTLGIFQHHLNNGLIREKAEYGIEQALVGKGIKYLKKEEWKRIEDEENRRGALEGKPKEKMIHLEEMLSFLGK